MSTIIRALMGLIVAAVTIWLLLATAGLALAILAGAFAAIIIALVPALLFGRVKIRLFRIQPRSGTPR